MADRIETDPETRTTTTSEEIDHRPVREGKVPGSVVAQRVIYYIGGAIITILALRFLLQLLAANQGNFFVDFIYGLSGFFVAPFWGIFGEPTYGQSQFETSTLVAMIVYGILTVAIARLLTIGSEHPEAYR